MCVAHLFSDKVRRAATASPQVCNGSDLQSTRVYCRSSFAYPYMCVAREKRPMGKGVSQSDKRVVAGSRTRRLYKLLVAQTCAVKQTNACLTAKLAATRLTT